MSYQILKFTKILIKVGKLLVMVSDRYSEGKCGIKMVFYFVSVLSFSILKLSSRKFRLLASRFRVQIRLLLFWITILARLDRSGDDFRYSIFGSCSV